MCSSDLLKQRGFNIHEEKTRRASDINVISHTEVPVIFPEGRSLSFVLGFLVSISLSMMRFRDIPAVLAPNMARVTHSHTEKEGIFPAATITPR